MGTTTLRKNTAANPICYSSLHMLTDLKQFILLTESYEKT